MIRWLCRLNRLTKQMTEDMKNAGDYEFFRMAVQSARKAVKGSGPRCVKNSPDRGGFGLTILFHVLVVCCRRQGDPHANTVNDSYTSEEYGKIGLLLVGGAIATKALPRWTLLQVAMTQLFVHLMHFGAGRGDDTRVMHIADIGKPRKVDALSDAVDCYMLPIVLFGTKTQSVSRGCGGVGVSYPVWGSLSVFVSTVFVLTDHLILLFIFL
jgi:hypothetical protein